MRDGQVVAATLIATDITERKQAEEALQARTHDLGERVKELDCLYGVASLVEQHGNVLDGMLQDVVELLPTALQHPEAACARVVLGGRQFKTAAFRESEWMLASDISVRGERLGAVEVYYLEKRPERREGPFLSQERRLIDAVAERLGRVIERARTEEALRESEARLRSVIQSVMIGILFWDATGNVTDANDAFLEMVGYAKPEILSRAASWRDMTPPEYKQLDDRALEEVATTGVMTPIEKEYIRKDGSRIPILLGAASLPGPELSGVAFVLDITERKRAEEELARLNKQLRETARQAGMAEIASNVLHNVGNVLNSVNISAQLVVNRAKDCRIDNLTKAVEMLKAHADDIGEFMATDPKGRRIPEFLEILAGTLTSERAGMLEEMSTMARHVEHIKEIVSLQQSHARAYGVAERVAVADVVEDAIKINSASMERHSIRIEREHGDVPPVLVEEHKLIQVLVNLVSNARYALIHSERPDKAITVRTSSAGDDGVRVEVTDNGVGIAQENLERIFNRGFTTRKDGHGFGLHDAAIAAKEMGASLKAQSDGPGKGAVFALELPLRPPEAT
jgi:PAS domain S-box-containing protein